MGASGVAWLALEAEYAELLEEVLAEESEDLSSEYQLWLDFRREVLGIAALLQRRYHPPRYDLRVVIAQRPTQATRPRPAATHIEPGPMNPRTTE